MFSPDKAALEALILILFFQKRKRNLIFLLDGNILYWRLPPPAPPSPPTEVNFLVPLGEGDLMVFGKTLYFIG